jgi:hypothetical protein
MSVLQQKLQIPVHHSIPSQRQLGMRPCLRVEKRRAIAWKDALLNARTGGEGNVRVQWQKGLVCPRAKMTASESRYCSHHCAEAESACNSLGWLYTEIISRLICS